MITLTITIIMIILLPQVKNKAADLLLVKAAADNSEALHSKAEARDLSTIGFRETHIRVAPNQYSSHHKPYFQGNQFNSYRGQSRSWGPQQTRGRGHGRANYQSNNNNYQYQYYTLDQQTEQYGPPCSLCGGFIIPLSIATKENMI